MRKTTNYGLALYDKEDKMNITSEENSLNHNMELIDSALKEIDNKSNSSSEGTGSGFTTEQISALDGMFKVCAYIKENVNTEYNAFKIAFGIDNEGGNEEPKPDTTKTLQSISATYTGGNVRVGTSVNSLTGLTVKAHYSDGTSSNVTGYTLSGTIAEGNNTITVTYQELTTTFIVIGIPEVNTDGKVDTTVQIETYDVGFNNSGSTTSATGLAVTKLYEFDNTGATGYFNLMGLFPYVDENPGSSTGRAQAFVDGVYVDPYSCYGSGKPLNKTNTEGKIAVNLTTNKCNGIKVTIAYKYIDDCYLYVEKTGQVLFAGKNTPYYGMSNIDGTLIEA